MALRLISTVPNCLEYIMEAYPRYCNPALGNFCTAGNLGIMFPLSGDYAERISTNGIKHFFYEPANDLLVAFIWMDHEYLPGWGVRVRLWNADTGQPVVAWPLLKQNLWPYDCGAGVKLCNKVEYSYWQTININAYSLAVQWSSGASCGSYGGIYIVDNNWKIKRVNWHDFSMLYVVTDPQAWKPPHILNPVIVDEGAGTLVGAEGGYLNIWRYGGTPELLSQLRLPGELGYLTYEDNQRCWIITKTGIVAKANYQERRWEMISTVQNLTEDAINFFCAFDSKRKRLVVLRQRPDAPETGASQCQLEFYQPLSKITLLTDPVPVSPLRVGEKARFVAHLCGDAGEGVAGYIIHAELQAPELGRVLTPISAAELNGAATLRYTSAEAGEDTMQLSVDIPEGA